MSFRNISAWSIRNPVPPLVIFAALLLAGIVSFLRMDVNNNPDIDFPAAQVTVVQPGAAPTELETQVTQRVEAALRGVSGVDEINSSVNEGVSNTFVQFAIGTPIDRAVTDVRDAVSQIRSDLPDGILEPQVQRVDIAGGPLAYFSVEATDMTLEQLSWYVDNTVAKRLLSIGGMSAVNRGGGVSREIRVILDPVKLQAQGITASQVNDQLRQVNVNAAGGRAEIAGSEQSVRVLGNAATAYRLGETQIALGGGRTTRLSDIAMVRDLYAEQRSLSTMNGREVLSFGFSRSKGASDVTVYDAAVKELEALEKENGKVKFKQLFTSVDYTKAQYHSAMEAMIEGAILAVIVVFVFLRDWRATVISAIAIPLSAIPTFWFMDLMGFTLNELTLLALSLVAGVLVDDAIVEIENIVRHMRMGKSAYQASIDAADEIGLAVLATTMAIVAVFLPVGLMPGISGQFFKNFGFTVVAAVLMSLAVARMITPLLAAYFLQAKGHASHGEGRLMDGYMSVLRWTLDTRKSTELRSQLRSAPGNLRYWLVEALFVLVIIASFGVTLYLLPKLLGPLGLLAWLNLTASFALALVAGWVAALLLNVLIFARGGGVARHHLVFVGQINARVRDHRIWTIGIGAVAFLATIFAFSTLPLTFQPTINSSYSQVQIEMPPGSTLDQTRAVVQGVTDRIGAAPEVESAFADINVGGTSTIYLTLDEERTMTRVEFERSWAQRLNETADARVSFQSQSGGFSGRDVTISLGGDDPVVLKQAADRVIEQMAAMPELRAPRIVGDLQRPEIVIAPRHDIAADLGVTTAALSQTIRIATLGEIDQNAAKFSLSDRQIPIRVALDEGARQNLSTIENLPVPTSRGGSVPLKLVADISFGAGPTTLQRSNQIRRISVGADLAPGEVSGDVTAKVNQLTALTQLPQGVKKLTLGDSKWQAELLVSFAIAVVSGVLMVFAVLVLLYRRLLPPLVNMGSLLLAPLGGAIALHIAGQPVSMPVFIGLLMLLGIVAKNSILLVDFALEEMNKGVDLFTAIVDSGHKRAQPIVMTTVAMVAGMVPIALSLTGDGSWRAPMGVTVIGGLILSTVLTLIIVPASFSLAVGFEQWAGPRLSKRLLTYKPGDDRGPQAVQPAE